MRRPMHEGQKPRPLQLNATRRLSPAEKAAVEVGVELLLRVLRQAHVERAVVDGGVERVEVVAHDLVERGRLGAMALVGRGAAEEERGGGGHRRADREARAGAHWGSFLAISTIRAEPRAGGRHGGGWRAPPVVSGVSSAGGGPARQAAFRGRDLDAADLAAALTRPSAHRTPLALPEPAARRARRRRELRHRRARRGKAEACGRPCRRAPRRRGHRDPRGRGRSRPLGPRSHPPPRCRRRDRGGARARPEAPRRRARRHDGAAHLGARPRVPSAPARDRDRRRALPRRRTMDPRSPPLPLPRRGPRRAFPREAPRRARQGHPARRARDARWRGGRPGGVGSPARSPSPQTARADPRLVPRSRGSALRRCRRSASSTTRARRTCARTRRTRSRSIRRTAFSSAGSSPSARASRPSGSASACTSPGARGRRRSASPPPPPGTLAPGLGGGALTGQW